MEIRRVRDTISVRNVGSGIEDVEIEFIDDPKRGEPPYVIFEFDLLPEDMPDAQNSGCITKSPSILRARRTRGPPRREKRDSTPPSWNTRKKIQKCDQRSNDNLEDGRGEEVGESCVTQPKPHARSPDRSVGLHQRIISKDNVLVTNMNIDEYLNEKHQVEIDMLKKVSFAGVMSHGVYL